MFPAFIENQENTQYVYGRLFVRQLHPTKQCMIRYQWQWLYWSSLGKCYLHCYWATTSCSNSYRMWNKPHSGLGCMTVLAWYCTYRPKTHRHFETRSSIFTNVMRSQIIPFSEPHTNFTLATEWYYLLLTVDVLTTHSEVSINENISAGSIRKEKKISHATGLEIPVTRDLQVLLFQI